MTPNRRDLARLGFAGAATLAASELLLTRSSIAEPADQAAVAQAVEALRKAILEADETRLRDLVADKLSYGLWPSGEIQDKSEFIGVIAGKGTIYTAIAYSDPSITIAGDDAIVRHRESVKAHNDAGVYSVDFGVLQIWQKQNGRWRLLARQGWNT